MAIVAGTLGRPLLIETKDGPEDSGDVVYPVTIELSVQTGHQVGQGYRTFTAYDGAKVSAVGDVKGQPQTAVRGALP